jgi:hypothetical protein
VTLTKNRDGRLEVFGPVGRQLFHAWQVAPNAGWSAWYALADDVDAVAAITSSLASDGRVVAAWRVASTGGAAAVRQTAPGAGWDRPVGLPLGAVSSGPTLSNDAGGTWVAACGGPNTVVIAALGNNSGNWVLATAATATSCRGTAVLADRPGPIVLVWANTVLATTPGKAASTF